MSKETPVTGGNDSYVDLDRQVWRLYLLGCLLNQVLFSISVINSTFLVWKDLVKKLPVFTFSIHCLEFKSLNITGLD